jgi:aminopeptidase
MKKAKMMKKYARLIAEIGIGAGNKQDVVIKAPTETYQFVRYLTLELYNCKARSVTVDWSDSTITKQTLMHVSPSRLDDVPNWEIVREKERIDKNFSRIIIEGEDPAVFHSVSPDRLTRSNKARIDAFHETRIPYLNNELAWCIAAVPTKAWAKRIFPDLSPTQAVLKLWNCIYQACRVDEDSDTVSLWNQHIAELKTHAKIMTLNDFKALHYTNAAGTDLTIGLAEGHLWGSAEAIQSRNGNSFVPNIPTEEIFSMPDCNRVDGKVYSTKPLSYNGVIIDGFWIEFKDGKAVKWHADVGEDKLTEIINYDESSSRLGEVALVPYDSPISKQKIIYQSTLFDENASCHLALGQSFAENLKGGDKMSEDEQRAHGGNQSKIHVDFMIGSADLNIDGIRKDGKIVPVFRKGNFAF